MPKPFITTDLELIQLLKQDDSSAFRTLYDRYWDKLYCIALGRLKDNFEAEEVVQDVYTRLWKNRSKLIIETELSRYLAVAVKYEVINRLAKRARSLDRTPLVTKNLYPVIEHDIHDRIDFKNLLKEVHETILCLPPQCRIVFTMSRKEHCSHKEIAEQLQISEKTVQKHITLALKTLRGKYAGIDCLLIFLALFYN
ncbi:MAG TPA: RNA polymerase sigma-70 factor [Sphingobacteriaceae bacterium]